MFERFTERARQVVVLAQEEARELGHNFIGTEHLLLGLIREEEGLAARVLASLEVSLDDARARIGSIVGPGDEPPGDQIPFTPRAKKVLELALREALSLGHNYIGTEHVLLGLVREREGVAVLALAELGVHADRVRDEVIGMLSGIEAPRRPVRRARLWDYRVEPLGELEGSEELQPLGVAGWELVAVVGQPGAYRGVFKRPR